MIIIKTESKLPNGLVRRRYEITLTDLLGKTHTEVVGIFNHNPGNDGSEIEAQLLIGKKQQEVEFYKDEIREGRNPFSDLVLQWNTRGEALKAVLDDALSLPATDLLVLNGLPFLALTTDEELKTIYGQTQEWVNSVRTKAAELLTAKTNLDNYQAVL